MQAVLSCGISLAATEVKLLHHVQSQMNLPEEASLQRKKKEWHRRSRTFYIGCKATVPIMDCRLKFFHKKYLFAQISPKISFEKGKC